jgi:hypothetical protein
MPDVLYWRCSAETTLFRVSPSPRIYRNIPEHFYLLSLTLEGNRNNALSSLQTVLKLESDSSAAVQDQ